MKWYVKVLIVLALSFVYSIFGPLFIQVDNLFVSRMTETLETQIVLFFFMAVLSTILYTTPLFKRVWIGVVVFLSAIVVTSLGLAEGLNDLYKVATQVNVIGLVITLLVGGLNVLIKNWRKIW